MRNILIFDFNIWYFMWCFARFNFMLSTVLSQAAECSLNLYEDDSCLLFQHRIVTEVKKKLTKDFRNICDWFVDNKLSKILEKTKRNQFHLILKVHFLYVIMSTAQRLKPSETVLKRTDYIHLANKSCYHGSM